jgi:Kef-type K+ transport system membrane component KefB
MVNEIFINIGMIIMVATALTLIVKLLKQPIIPAYILTGLLIGPVFGWITNSDIIATLSEMGIAFLLFIVGLEIDLKKLKHVVMISTLGSLIRSFVLFGLGYFVALALGIFTKMEAMYLGIVVAFSSTMVVIKLLSDKQEMDTLHARIMVGILLMEDLAAIFVVSLISNTSFSTSTLGFALLKVIVLLGIAYGLGKFILPPILRFSAKNHEVLFLISVCILFGFSLLAEYLGSVLTYALGFLPQNILMHLHSGLSLTIGAFIAGIILGSTAYNFEIISKVKALRDFFSILFFVSLWIALQISSIKSILIPMLVFIVFIFIAKPLVTMIICSLFGYKKRISFLTSISLSQISEFGLIIVALGMTIGHISQEIVLLTVLLSLISMAATTYFINYEYWFYRKISKFLTIFEKLVRHSAEPEDTTAKKKIEVVLCGHNRIGYSVYKTLREMKKKMLVVDYNPEIIKNLTNQDIPCIYGDVGDIEIIERMHLSEIKMLISTVPDLHDNLMLINKTKQINRKAVMFVTATQIDDALLLYDAGADYVILPHFLGGQHVSILIEEFSKNVGKIMQTKLEQINELHERRLMGHEHPQHNK